MAWLRRLALLTCLLAPSVGALHVRLSPMVQSMALSKTIEIHSLTKEMERNGETVFSLCVGEPDYQPPIEVIQATSTAALLGLTKYTGVSGEASLRRAIAQDLAARKHTPYTADQILVSNGAKQAVIQALMAVTCPGDKVVIPAPYWPSYPDMVKMCGGVPLVLPTSAENNYIPTADDLRLLLASNPTVSSVILCNPSNPTGSVASEKQLLELAAVLDEHKNVFVISDEIYERITYDVPHTSFAALPNQFDRTITINGFSKSHSMTGYRLGYAAGNIEVIRACTKIQSQLTSCASSIAQYAATEALVTVSDAWMTDRVVELKTKRDLAYRLIQEIPHVSCPLPNGAFYLLPNIQHYYHKKTKSGRIVSDSHDICLELLREEKVALVSGDAFGAPDTLRISYAASEELITESIRRLGKFLASLE